MEVIRPEKALRRSLAWIIIATLTYAEDSAKTSDEEDEGGLGSAEMIVIAVCSLIVIAFLLSCYVMIRNANKRKRMA